jgi:hypothetical protein
MRGLTIGTRWGLRIQGAFLIDHTPVWRHGTPACGKLLFCRACHDVQEDSHRERAGLVGAEPDRQPPA